MTLCRVQEEAACAMLTVASSGRGTGKHAPRKRGPRAAGLVGDLSREVKNGELLRRLSPRAPDHPAIHWAGGVHDRVLRYHGRIPNVYAWEPLFLGGREWLDDHP